MAGEITHGGHRPSVEDNLKVSMFKYYLNYDKFRLNFGFGGDMLEKEEYKDDWGFGIDVSPNPDTPETGESGSGSVGLDPGTEVHPKP